jgi:hypothetical protein
MNYFIKITTAEVGRYNNDYNRLNGMDKEGVDVSINFIM